MKRYSRFLNFLFITSSIVFLFNLININKAYTQEQLPAEPIPSEIKPTFSSIKSQIIDQKCLKCHGPGQAVQRIPLETYEDLTQSPLEIVIPGSPKESGIYIVVSSKDEDDIMPPPFFKGQPTGLLPLSEQEVNAIFQWISNGALNN